MKNSLIVSLIFLIFLVTACTSPVAEKETPVKIVEDVSSASDLSRLSIKELPLLTGYSLTEKSEPWEIIKEEVDYAFSQNFVKIGAGVPKDAPNVVLLDARTYKTLQTAQEKYAELYEEETELGTRTERNKEDIVMGGRNAKLSLIRPDTGSYVVQILFLDGKTVIMILVADFTKYREDLAKEIAEAVAQKI
ncbi:hypothetical protein HYU40_00495 [Candidatus Woesearchaeota archaeon]|nr:hypothetical protein [Candidatus Woesearchaeota archaeon]